GQRQGANARTAPRGQHPGRDEAVGPFRRERLGQPAARALQDRAAELEQAVAAEPAVRPSGEPGSGTRPELRAEDAEREVGVREELVQRPAPGDAVARLEAVEL